jgi:hypothetical protein
MKLTLQKNNDTKNSSSKEATLLDQSSKKVSQSIPTNFEKNLENKPKPQTPSLKISVDSGQDPQTKTISIKTSDQKNTVLEVYNPPTDFKEKLVTKASDLASAVSVGLVNLKENIGSYRDQKNTDKKEDTNTTEKPNSVLMVKTQNENSESLSTYVKPVGIIKTVVTNLFDPLHIVSYLIGLTACVLFVYTALADKISILRLPNLRLELVSQLSFAVMVLLDVVLVYFITTKIRKGLYIFLALFVMQLVCFLYTFRLSGTVLFHIGSWTVTTNLVVLLLPIIIFWQCLDIINNRNTLLLKILQAGFIFAQLYSTISLLNSLTYDSELQVNSIYKLIRQVPFYVWSTFSAFVVALLTSYGLRKRTATFIFVLLVMIPTLNIIMLTRTTTFWYQTLLALIVWDLIYQPIFEVDQDVNDSRALPKLFVSSVYHIFLFACVLCINSYINLIK